MSESILAIIGGGRWGQVHLSIAAKLFVPFDRIIVVSAANVRALNAYVAELNKTSHTPIEIVNTLDELLERQGLKAAIIVNLARQHFETARLLLNNKVSLLIEKPVVLTQIEMRILIDTALQQNICIVPGLNYRFCSYLKNFSDLVAKKTHIKQFSLDWTDIRDEQRYGRIKRVDPSISIVEDVIPHVWTIISQIFMDNIIKVIHCEREDNSKAHLNLLVNNIPGKVDLNRHGDYRKRLLSLKFESGNLILDFSEEPGIIISGDEKQNADPQWHEKLSPLARQLEYFFMRVAEGKSDFDDLQCCLGSVKCLEDAVIASLVTA
jgi:predicted dehydrogenase